MFVGEEGRHDSHVLGVCSIGQSSVEKSRCDQLFRSSRRKARPLNSRSYRPLQTNEQTQPVAPASLKHHLTILPRRLIPIGATHFTSSFSHCRNPHLQSLNPRSSRGETHPPEKHAKSTRHNPDDTNCKTGAWRGHIAPKNPQTKGPDSLFSQIPFHWSIGASPSSGTIFFSSLSHRASCPAGCSFGSLGTAKTSGSSPRCSPVVL